MFAGLGALFLAAFWSRDAPGADEAAGARRRAETLARAHVELEADGRALPGADLVARTMSPSEDVRTSVVALEAAEIATRRRLRRGKSAKINWELRGTLPPAWKLAPEAWLPWIAYELGGKSSGLQGTWKRRANGDFRVKFEVPQSAERAVFELGSCEPVRNPQRLRVDLSDRRVGELVELGYIRPVTPPRIARGRLLGGDGLPIAGVEVRIRIPMGDDGDARGLPVECSAGFCNYRRMPKARSDADGVFDLLGWVGCKEVELVAEIVGRGTARDVVAPGAVDVELTAPSVAALEVRLNVKAPQAIRLELRRDGVQVASHKLAPGGKRTFEAIAPGRYQLRAFNARGEDVWSPNEVSLAAGDYRVLKVKL